jgi:acetylornithine deacetylase/succinyl-diaminopimelate desuccinylase-like protein
MSRALRTLPFVLTLALLSSLQCRKAAGVPADPLDAQAEEALVGYIKIDTSNPPGNETAGAKYLQELLAREGIESQLVGSDPNRQSLYARLKSGSNEPALLLTHHIDVVPATPSEWTRPPFSGAQESGYIWGRGALDIKSLGIAQLMALAELKRKNVPLRRDIIYFAVADEELGGLRGCKELLETRPELFEDVGFVINEGGTNETIVDRVSFWGIEVQQKVPLWLRLTTEGSGGHGATPRDGGGAVKKIVGALTAIDTIETPYRLTPAVAKYFREAGKARQDVRGEILRTISEPLDIKRIEEVLPPGYRALLRDTISMTRISAGTAVNVLPLSASADVDIRLLPGSDTAPMLAEVKKRAGSMAAVDVLLAGEATPESTTDTELYRTMSRAMREAEPGSRVTTFVSAGTTDSRFFRARGIVAYGIAPFKVNYYDADSVHGIDERIRAKFFAQGARLMRRIVRDFCAR